jgi:malic enzyme
MFDQVPEWAKAAMVWIVGGGAAAIGAQKGLAHFKTAGLDVKAAELHGGILEQMGAQMHRLENEHRKMSAALDEANNLLMNVQKKLAHMDLLLSKMHLLLVANDVEVPEYVHEYFRREII